MTEDQKFNGNESLSGNGFKFIKSRPWYWWAADICLTVAVAVVVIYSITVGVKVASGYSVEQATTQHIVKLQLVDASGGHYQIPGLIKNLQAIAGSDLNVEIVEVSTFEVRKIARSSVISRHKDLAAARFLSEQLGLDPDEVEYQPLINNKNHVTATLVLGTKDLGLKLETLPKKET